MAEELTSPKKVLTQPLIDQLDQLPVRDRRNLLTCLHPKHDIRSYLEKMIQLLNPVNLKNSFESDDADFNIHKLGEQPYWRLLSYTLNDIGRTCFMYEQKPDGGFQPLGIPSHLCRIYKKDD